MRLTAVTGTRGSTRALKEGEVRIPGVELDFEEVPVLVRAFRRMVRGLEWDVCEMAATTYLVAKAHGKAFTALPVFPVRGFHQGAIVRGKDVRHPKDLEGRRVGVNRGYTVTTGVWARAALRTGYGVDLDSITWVLSGDEHVAEYVPPPNVSTVPPGRTLEDLLAEGDLAAAIGVEGEPLIPDAEAAGMAALRRDGWYPINHLIVVKDEVLARNPGLAGQLFGAFTESKRRWTPDDLYGRIRAATGADPLPYGLDANRGALEALVDAALDQHILDRRPDLDTLFAKVD